jgi:hypothetical protein
LLCTKRRIAVRMKLQRIAKTYKTAGTDDLPKVGFVCSASITSPRD